ncbi:MAG: D-alanyl-D-alanine endopeptidase [Chromatiales bacterium]|nr:D-alanyl-D-alanine endopeptidase [Chromatiales bacterium]
MQRFHLTITILLLTLTTTLQANTLWDRLDPKKLHIKSESALVIDSTGTTVFAKKADISRPIASITKLMTAMVVLDAKLPMDEKITITKADRDLLRLTGSRLSYGATLSRREMLQVALIASDNRAAAALGRTYPGGTPAFVEAMNRKAQAIGMTNSRFSDPTGLEISNMASAYDLSRMVRYALSNYPLIRATTTRKKIDVRPYRKRGPLTFGNTNRLLKNKAWEIELTKTGYINEAGRCLVMAADIADEPLVIVLLNSFGKLTPFGDSNRLRKWIEAGR